MSRRPPILSPEVGNKVSFDCTKVVPGQFDDADESVQQQQQQAQKSSRLNFTLFDTYTPPPLPVVADNQQQQRPVKRKLPLVIDLTNSNDIQGAFQRQKLNNTKCSKTTPPDATCLNTTLYYVSSQTNYNAVLDTSQQPNTSNIKKFFASNVVVVDIDEQILANVKHPHALFIPGMQQHLYWKLNCNNNENDTKRTDTNAGIIQSCDIKPTDVKFGRGNAIKVWHGNVQWRSVLQSYQLLYKKLHRNEKGGLVRSLVKYFVVDLKVRFLQSSPNNTWSLADYVAIVDKFQQFLRE